MRNQLVVGSVIVAFSLGGCASMTETQKGTAKGAGIGAGVGAVVGAIAGKGKGAAIGAVVGAGVGAVAGNVWTKRQEEQKRQMEEATAGTGVAVTQTADNRLKLDIPSDISFAVNRADIQSNFRTILNTFATSTGSDAVNNPLSLNRAASVRDYLAARGVNSSRVSIDGRGSREPIVSNDTAANKAKNRRVEIFVAEPAPVASAQ